MTRALVCVLCIVWMWMYDDSNVCFMHACLLGGRCLGRRCKVLLTHPGYTLRRLCLPESEKKKKKKKKKKLHFCNVLCTVSNISIIILSCPSLNFIYLLMWHFCYTEHVSFIYIYIDYVYVFFFFFLKPFHFIIFILFYMIIIIISVAVALAAMFSLSDSLLTIAFS